MSIGATLSAGRAAAGLTVDDVSAATRVRGSLIRQIERDEFAGCGGAIYARGHIRSIASVVGVDAEPLVAEFNALHGGPGGPAVRQVLERPELVQGRTSPNWTAAMFVVAVLLAGVAFVALFTGGGTPAVDPIAGGPVTATTVPPSQAASQPAAAQASRQPAPETSAGTTAATTEPAATATSTPPAVVALSGVNVRVTVSGAKCWMRVSDGSAAGPGKVLFEDTLDHGVTREFTATRKLSLLIGNAGAVTLNVNGRDVGIAGKPGQVVTLPFEAGDPNAG